MTRFGYVMVTYFVGVGMAIAAFIPTPTKLIWNATASAPIGFYTVEPAERIAVPELVAIMPPEPLADRSEEHTSELQSLMRISYAVFCLKKKKITTTHHHK